MPRAPLPILAQEGIGSIFLWSFVLIILVVVLFFFVVWIRRQLAAPDPTKGSGFTLSDLRALHKSGQISDLEFEKAKEMVLATMKKAQEMPKVAGQVPQTPIDRVQNKRDPEA